MTQNINNDLLLQIAEQQAADSKVLHEMKGNLVARVESLESTHKWNKVMTYVVTPFLVVVSTVARHFGVKV
jgi:hypothetical protein